MYTKSNCLVFFVQRVGHVALPGGKRFLRVEDSGEVRPAGADEFRVEYKLQPAFYVELVIRVHSFWEN